MAEFPYLPMWTDAYLADTTHLRTEEHGAYLLLLFAAWRNADCSLPDDDAILARLAGMSAPKWSAAKPIVMSFWVLDKRKKKWTQKRLKDEREKATVKKSKARDSAASRWKQKKTGDANAMRSECYPEPEPYPVRKPSGFPPGAPAREKPKGWIDRKTHSQALNEIISRIEDHEQRGTEIGSAVTPQPLQLLSASGSGRR